MVGLPDSNLVMLTRISDAGQLDLYLERRAVKAPAAHEVVVKMLAAPINPSDLGLMVGAADASTARTASFNDLPAVSAEVSPGGLRAMAGRIGEALPIGNEGAGEVIAAGESPEAQALLGKTVALFGGECFAQYRTIPAAMCLALPDGVSAEEGASCFVNPLTALGFTETMRMDGHKAIIHTAAASNLGQMLNRICLADGIPLISIVRSAEQAAILTGQGATRMLNSADEDFLARLTDQIAETGATIAFDAIGGGKLQSQILSAMEQAAIRTASSYSRYGSDTFKQLYIYGALDMAPTVLTRSFGFQWSVSGWLLMPFLMRAGPDVQQRMRARVIAELKTTFASHYSHRVTMEEALTVEALTAYNAKRTGEKYLVCPHGL